MSAAAIGLGALCALPAWALVAARYLALRRFLDGRARRAYLAKASAFAAASVGTCALVAAAGERFALPAHWAAALAVAALVLLSRAFKREG